MYILMINVCLLININIVCSHLVINTKYMYINISPLPMYVVGQTIKQLYI